MNESERFIWLIGIVSIIVIVCFVLILIVTAIKELVHTLKRIHVYKHRFDKPPTAKCYCKDCKRWNNRNGNGYCGKFEGWCTADNWFCWDAEPSDKKR